MNKTPLLFLLIFFLSCSSTDSAQEDSSSPLDIGVGSCNSIIDCSTNETREYVCVKRSCISIGAATKVLHIVFYPKYISSVVNNIEFFRYFYLYPLDTSGNNITCESLLKNYNLEGRTDLNIIQSYEKQGTISSMGSETYTLPLPQIKDSLIFFIFYDGNKGAVALGCKDGIDTTSDESIGIFPCKPEQTNACLGQF